MAEPELTNREAVRLAMVELGNDAPRKKIQAFVKDRFQLDLNLDSLSTTKSQIRKELGEQPTAPKQAAPEHISKNEAVYRAVVELGPEASRQELQSFVKEHFGHQMELNHISAAKVTAVRKLAASPPNGKTVLMGDILKLRELVERVGADHLRTLIGVITGGDQT